MEFINFGRCFPLYYCTIYLFYFITISTLSVYIWIHNISSENPFSANTVNNTYDYIIVGSGTAGITVAHGLRTKNVLILESGTFTSTLLDVPLITPALQGTTFDWSYYTVAQKNACLALTDQRCRWPRGKGVGGSQILNFMIYNEGHREDYRGWFSSADEYNYEKDILPYFREITEEIKPNQNYHKTILSKAFIDAAIGYGYSENSFFSPNITADKGLRRTLAHIYLFTKPHRHQIISQATVETILFDPNQPNRISGVEFYRNNRRHKVFARNGIILSSGTIGSPEILLKSGIGPKNTYADNFAFKYNLPVGLNLQDHVTTGIDLIFLNQSLSVADPWDIITPKTLYDYITKGRGPFSMNGCEALGFISNSNFTNPPDIGYMVLPIGLTIDGGVHFRKILNVNDKTWQNYFKPIIGQNSVSILPIVLRPKSRGKIFLKNGSVAIDPMYLSHEDDVQQLVKAIQILKQFLEMPALKKLGAELNPKEFPGCEGFLFDSVDYWQCYVRHLTLTAYHPVGTCKIGSKGDPTAVVDQMFRLIGFENIYVVDASVMPNVPSANPNAAVYMLAKKFLSLINVQ